MRARARWAPWFSVRLPHSPVRPPPRADVGSAPAPQRALGTGLWAPALLPAFPGVGVRGEAPLLLSPSPKSPWSSSHLATQPEFYYLQTNAKFLSSLPLCRLPQPRGVLFFEVREKAANLSMCVSPSVFGWRLLCTLWPLKHMLLNSRAQLLEFKNICF